MEDFRAHLDAIGFPIPLEAQILDGQIHRFKCKGDRDDGWLIGWIHQRGNGKGTFCYVEFGSWADTEGPRVFQSDKPSSGDKAFVAEKAKEAKKKFEIVRKEKLIVAVKKTEKLLAGAKSEGTTAYLQKKKIGSLFKALIDPTNRSLVIPMRDYEGNPKGAQRIFENGDKRHIPGSQKSKAFHLFGELKGTVYLCEGWATGATIHETTGGNVAVCFDADNLVEIARQFRIMDHTLDLRICGDDDRFKEKNKGRESAEKAGEASMSPVFFPRFPEGVLGTDFNDLFVACGADAVRACLIEEKEVTEGFRPLGYDDLAYYFYKFDTADILRLSQLNQPNLIRLMDLKFWDQNYRPGDATKTNWSNAANDLIRACEKEGRFTFDRVRGTGVWKEGNDIVVNLGAELFVGGAYKPISWCQKTVTYVRSEIITSRLPKPLTTADCEIVIDSAKKFKWIEEQSALLVAGWIAIARIGGALPVRPHIWITGGAGSGKSSLFKHLINPCIGKDRGALLVQGGSTEAGIRQKMRNMSVPTIFDEFELVDKRTGERQDALLELFRNSWSETDGKIYKGTAGGNFMSFECSTIAALGSVQVVLPTEADRSRYSVLELEKKKNPRGEWEAMKAAMKPMDENNFSEALYARSIKNVNMIIQSYEVLSSLIGSLSYQRMGQQLGMLMAGYWSLISDSVISEEEAQRLVELLKLEQEMEGRVSEEEECLSHLLSFQVRMDWTKHETLTIRQAIFGLGDESMAGRDLEAMRKELRKFGVAVNSERNSFTVDSAHSFLSNQVFAGTRWKKWGLILQRLPGVKPRKSINYDKHKVGKGTEIPLSLAEQSED